MKKIISLIILLISIDLFASYYSRGCTAYTYKNYDKAIEYFTKAIEANPKDGNSYYFLGEVYKIQKQYDKAITNFQLAIENRITKKYLKLAYWNLIVLSEQNGNIEEMVRSCRIFWDKTRDPGAKSKVDDTVSKMLWTSNEKAKTLYREGKNLEKKGKSVDAFNKYTDALSEDNNFLAARYEVGMYYYNKGSIDQATDHFRIISDNIPFYTAVNLLTANIYFKNKSYSTAHKYYTNALEFGFLGKSTKYKALLRRGTCNFKMDQLTEAAEDIEKCRKLYRNRTNPLFLLSAIYIKDSKFQEAAKILERLNRLKPGNKQVLFQLGSIYYKEENNKFAQYFDKLFDIESKSNKNSNDSYIKAFKILAKHHFQNKAYKRTSTIITYLPEREHDYDLKIMHAESEYFNHNYDNAVEILEKLSLNDDKKILMVKSYIKSKNTEKAVEYIKQNAAYSNDFLSKAKNDSLIKKYAIQAEKELTDEKTKEETISTDSSNNDNEVFKVKEENDATDIDTNDESKE